MSTFGDLHEVTDELTVQDQWAVIRWVMHKRFTYIAIRVRESWYTTATEENTIVGQKLTSVELARVLMDEHSEDFSIVKDWVGLGL